MKCKEMMSHYSEDDLEHEKLKLNKSKELKIFLYLIRYIEALLEIHETSIRLEKHFKGFS